MSIKVILENSGKLHAYNDVYMLKGFCRVF